MIFEVSRKRPILAVVGVVCSIRTDAAYGGYVRGLFLDENGNFMNKEQLAEQLKLFGIIGDKKERQELTWPHKLGYILYPAGGIAMKDKRMRESIQTFAPYVFPRPQEGEPDALIGETIDGAQALWYGLTHSGPYLREEITRNSQQILKILS